MKIERESQLEVLKRSPSTVHKQANDMNSAGLMEKSKRDRRKARRRDARKREQEAMKGLIDE